MFNGPIQNILNPLMWDNLDKNATQTAVLQRIPGFPYDVYLGNLTRYREAMSWFTGKALEPEENSKSEDYPVRINPLNGTCLKHAYALIGEVQDDGRPLILPKLVIERGIDKDSRKHMHEIAASGESALNRMWWENFGRSMIMRNAITTQILGGCVFHLRYVPYQKYRTIPMQIERVSPENFIGFPEPGDEFRLRESWVVKPITPADARTYGVDIPETQKAFWVEHWEGDKYKITINNIPVKYIKDGQDIPSEGANEFGFVPTVYIPHIRVGGFYGENVIDSVKGLVKEINLRWADTGDAHNTDTHAYVGMRNVDGNPSLLKFPGVNIINLGSSDAIGSSGHDPDMFEIHKPAVTGPAMTYLSALMSQYRRDANIPAVADGEDEGSQRSAATLVARMWPLISHTNTERINWSCGFDWLSVMALRMMEARKIAGITKEHTEMRIRQEFAPILPKDRETFVNELVNRAANDLGSPQHLLEMTGDVEDIDEEMTLIKEWLEFQAEMQVKATPPPQGGGGSMPGNGSTPGKDMKKKPGMTEPKKAE